MFAHKESKTITFGQEIRYDPSRSDTEERERICREAEQQMHDLYERACRKHP